MMIMKYLSTAPPYILINEAIVDNITDKNKKILKKLTKKV